jgi:isoquinoline 1-oxidoreductase subunit beta
MALADRTPRYTRRSLLITGGTAVGLIVGWQLWPRDHAVTLQAARGEFVFNTFVKIGIDGHVTVAVPQSEMGQGAFTTLAQIVADELGADWRTISVEAARPDTVYANTLLAEDWATPTTLPQWPSQSVPMATGGSTTVRGYEARLRQAGATARALLCTAAAKRWDADWEACDTAGGFIIRGDDKMRFGEVAAEAALLTLPSGVQFREGAANRLTGRSLPRLDAPAKIDGSAQFAADIRLPDMVYAAIAQGPLGDTRLISVDKKAAEAIPGVLQVIETERWVAVVANNSWAANRAVLASKAKFATRGPMADDRAIDRALDSAFEDGVRVAALGDVGASFRGAQIIAADYRIDLAPHAAIEMMSATAMLDKGELQLWIGTQVPGLAAAAAARAIGIAPENVAVHPMLVGGSFGRKFEVDIAGQAAILAEKLKRPVQLTWSRAEDMRQDRFRPAGAARMAARIVPGGRIDGWLAKYATPAPTIEMTARMTGGHLPHDALAATAGQSAPIAVAGGVPPYAIPRYAIDHHPAQLGIATGDWRGGGHGLTCFATECFVDELAAFSGNEPFSFRMGLLGDNTRLAQCLSKVAALGGWNGGEPGSGQGIACHSMAGSYIAVMAEARLEGDRVRVTRLVAVVDCGRVINPSIVRQQIGGGLIFGMSAATGHRITVTRGLVQPVRIGALGLPIMADAPHITIELINSKAPSGGVGELAVPPAAPAIANALFARVGKRYRTLPLLGQMPGPKTSV